MSNDTAHTFLYDLLSTPSPTGFEGPGQRKWVKYVRKHADTVENDAYGTAWATLHGKKPKSGQPLTVMLEAHADEIGYMIKHITSKGYLYLDRIGGSDSATARGRRLQILGDEGPVIGVIGNTAIHIRDRSKGEKAPEVHQLYVDVGASSAEEVADLGLRVGHPAVYVDTAEPFGKNRIVGRALDNRIGGYIIAQVMAKLNDDGKAKKPASTIIAMNAVQEEIGGLGAKMATYRLQPDIAICLDVTHATDTPNIEHNQHGEVILGGGPTVTHGTCNHPNVVKRIMEIAKKEKIPLQHESSSRFSGTDTDQIYHQRSGIPSALVSLPLRYMHSVVEVADLTDVQQTIDLLSAVARSIKPDDQFGVTFA
ncbi:MAG: putative aminopeptidase FrvX [Verrucomicrobiales bacterium]|jgi:putative aminopeptidase FrvX